LDELLKNLARRGFIPHTAETAGDVLKILTDNIPPGERIGFGGSMTVESLGLPLLLKAAGYEANHHHACEKSWAEVTRENRFVKYYVTSSNAITTDGILVNMDGRANRVSAMCYGPEKLFVVLGKNKLCADLAAAIERTEQVASPLNAQRLHRKTPCTVTGKCVKCNSPDTICRALLVLYHPTSSIETHVILIGQDLGF
jgi:hypothetical protein